MGLSSKYKSEGHCWICPLGCLYVPSDHPHRELIHDKLLLFANKIPHPVYINFYLFELSPLKIHAIKSLNPPAIFDIPDLAVEIIHILDTLSMNHLPCEVKTFVENCDITAHKYNQCTLSGAPDSMLGFKEGLFYNFLSFLDRDEMWRRWIARQERVPTNYLVILPASDGWIESLPAPPMDIPDCLQHRSRKQKPPPSLTTMIITSFHRLGINMPTTIHVG